MVKYSIYTDWACSGNPGPGWWGFVILENWIELLRKNGSKNFTTNNEMELSAVLNAIKHICQTYWIYNLNDIYSNTIFWNIHKNSSIHLHIYLDSQYVRQWVLDYLSDWKKRWRKTVKKKVIKNLELRQELDLYLWLFIIDWYRVKSHNGDKYNEIADLLATSAVIN